MKINLPIRLIIVCLLTQSAVATAQEARPLENDVAVEAHVQQLAQELRCLVCQNQTLADSHAELALDLKQEIREMVSKGMSDQDIIDYLVARYGDFVLYRPPFKLTTLFLWVGPFVLLLAGSFGLLMTLKQRAKTKTEQQLNPDEMRKVNELLNLDKKI